MRKAIPLMMGLAMCVGTVAYAQVPVEQDKVKVEDHGKKVKEKDTTYDATGKHQVKTKTKVKHHGDEVKVKEKEK
jgi:hypothetical protein